MSVRLFTPNENIRDRSDGTLRWGLVIRKTFRQQNLTVGTSATKLPTSPLTDRISLLIVNNSTSGQIVYIGDSTVSSANGIPLFPKQGMPITIEDNIDVYGVSSASGADIRILEGS